MTILYAAALVLGALGLFLVASSWWSARLGRLARAATAAVSGFGLAGMSASFAGWSVIPALAAAVATAAGLGLYAGSSWARDGDGA